MILLFFTFWPFGGGGLGTPGRPCRFKMSLLNRNSTSFSTASQSDEITRKYFPITYSTITVYGSTEPLLQICKDNYKTWCANKKYSTFQERNFLFALNCVAVANSKFPSYYLILHRQSYVFYSEHCG